MTTTRHTRPRTAWALALGLLLTTGCFSVPELGSKHDAGGGDAGQDVRAEAADVAPDALDETDLLDVTDWLDLAEALDVADIPDVTEPSPEPEVEVIEIVEVEEVETEALACEVVPWCSPDNPEYADLEPCQRVRTTADGCACEVVAKPAHAPCDDGDPCTIGDTCDALGVCTGIPLDGLCDDGDPCTADACTDLTCTYSFAEGACDDGNACTLGDQCAQGLCVPGAYDSATCGQCDPLADTCEAQWGDGNRCNGTLVCLADRQCHLDVKTRVTCPAAPAGACWRSACEPTTGVCQTTDAPEQAPCSDGNPCTTGDVCAAGVCGGSFDDSVAGCQCENDADCAPFDDGDACNGALICADQACVVGPDSVPAPCPDSEDTLCRVNRCDPATGACQMTDVPAGLPCQDGDPCTLGDACADGLCVPGAVRDCSAWQTACLDAACAAYLAAPQTGYCVQAPMSPDTACTPTDLCAAGGTSQAGVCTSTGPRDCDDGDGCTLDACEPGTGACTHTLTPNASPEVCDGQDNDCDGLTDADDTDLTRPACEKNTGVGAGMSKAPSFCVTGAWQPCDDAFYGLNAPEYASDDAGCDGLDNDCDGSTDEDWAATPTTCGVGACQAQGQTTCDAGSPGDTCTPGTPAADDATCDARDDDCDGQTDENWAQAPTTCGVGAR